MVANLRFCALHTTTIPTTSSIPTRPPPHWNEHARLGILKSEPLDFMKTHEKRLSIASLLRPIRYQILHERAPVTPIAQCHPYNMATCAEDQAHIGPIHVDKKIVASQYCVRHKRHHYGIRSQLQLVHTQSKITAPRGRICDNSVRSVRVSSILLGHKQIRRAPLKSPTRGRLGTRRSGSSSP
jgi:hypothetical protein